MRYIDAFCHFNPKRYQDELLESPLGKANIGKRVRGIPALWDLDIRLKVVDQFPDYSQVLSIGMPMIDRLWGPDRSPEMAKIANDGLADVVAKHPDRFAGYSCTVAMNAPETTAREAERALKNGACAIQIGTNANGGPIDGKEFWPLYEVIAKSGKPILLHPARSRELIDYAGEAKSKYEICSVLGWPYETGVALSRFIFSKIMDTHPDLKIVSHHLGGVIPYLEGRIGHSFDQMGARTSDEDYEGLRKSLKKRPFDYFKQDFYADTAIEGARSPMVCGLDFFGQDRVLFASDCPFDKENGPGYIRSTIAVLESIEMSSEMREKISHKNAQKLFGLK